MKNLMNLGKVLSEKEQKEVFGGRLSTIVCRVPYFSPDGTCQAGYHLHPRNHWVCCRD